MKLKQQTLYRRKTLLSQSLSAEEKELIGKIVLRLVVVAALLLGFYFWGVAIISNLDLLWRTLRLSPRPPAINARPSLPPLTPRLVSLPVATSSAEISLRGYAASGVTVKLFANEVEVQSLLTDKEGNFAFEEIPLAEGKNSFFVKAADPFNRESLPSRTVTTVFKEKPPRLVVHQPQERQSFTQKESEIVITGQTDSEVSVKVNELQMVVDENGNFRALYSLSEGENRLRFEASDLAGNKTALSRTVSFHRTF